MIAKIGVVPQQIPGGDIYTALERGTIDAAEWVGPYDDARLGFQKVAPYYYYPGWWEGGPMIHNFVNLDKWNSLSPAYRSLVRTASSLANEWMTSKYDASNPPALKKMLAENVVQFRQFPASVMDASLKAALEVYAEVSARNADFKKVWELTAGVPQRRVSLVAGRRIQLRRLSHPQSHENLKAANGFRPGSGGQP